MVQVDKVKMLSENRECLFKQGEKMNMLLKFKDGGYIRKMLTAAGGPINYKRWDNAKITSYTIPFIKEKAIKLTNAGKATGAVLSTNLLDSLANNAIQARVPVRTAIGLATKESTLGNPTDDRSAWNLSSRIRRLFNGVYPGTVQHINNGTSLVHGVNLINYHKGDIDHEMFNGTKGKSIIQEGLEFYKTHPDRYNPGLKGYQRAVAARGEEVMKSPEIQKWYREWEKSKAQIFRPEPYKINTNIQGTALEFVPLKKQEGSILELFKKGHKIHIKKENRGKFTAYCGGNVTSSCIAKAKASGNPTLIKRATFAANARKWKH